MEFEWHKDPTTLNVFVKIKLTDHDMTAAYPILRKRHYLELQEFSRPDASIEEKLMLLQLYAKVLEEVTA